MRYLPKRLHHNGLAGSELAGSELAGSELAGSELAGAGWPGVSWAGAGWPGRAGRGGLAGVRYPKVSWPGAGWPGGGVTGGGGEPTFRYKRGGRRGRGAPGGAGGRWREPGRGRIRWSARRRRTSSGPRRRRSAGGRPPGQHRRIERDAEDGAERLQHGPRPPQDVAGVDDRATEPPEDLELLLQPQVGQDRLGAHPGIRGEQRARVPDQERVPQAAQRAAVHLGQEVVRHVLLVVHGLAVRQRGRADLVEHLAPTAAHALHDLVAAGMGDTAAGQVEPVQRLVDDHRVRPVLPGAHQRRGDRARPGPHRDPYRRRGRGRSGRRGLGRGGAWGRSGRRGVGRSGAWGRSGGLAGHGRVVTARPRTAAPPRAASSRTPPRPGPGRWSRTRTSPAAAAPAGAGPRASGSRVTAGSRRTRTT